MIRQKSFHEHVAVVRIETKQAARLERPRHIFEHPEIIVIGEISESREHQDDPIELVFISDLPHIGPDILNFNFQGRRPLTGER